MTRPLIYVAGPIRLGDREANVHAAVVAGQSLARRGWAPIIPHLWDLAKKSLWPCAENDLSGWLDLDLSLLSRCDALVRLPGESVGADIEADFARNSGIRVFNSVNAALEATPAPARHPTSERIHAIFEELRALHDRKQADYGTDEDPLSNVRAAEAFGIPAWLGVAIRMNDKMRRLMTFARKGALVNDSVIDDFNDLTVYGVIGRVLIEEALAEEPPQ